MQSSLVIHSRGDYLPLHVFLVTQQPRSPTRLQMLLQYVILPSAGSRGPLRSELWVEPQHGTVCETPAGLSYLTGLTHQQINDKVTELHTVSCAHSPVSAAQLMRASLHW